MGDVGKEFGEDVVLLLYKSADCTCQKCDTKRVKTKGKTLKGKRLWIIQGADVGTPQEPRTDKSTRAVPGASHLIGGISLITGLTWSSESVSLVKSILITMVTCGL